jgi:hypothetical protein
MELINCLLYARTTMNSKTSSMLLSVALLSLVLTGCNQYEVSKDSQGRTIRLNKTSGEVTVIEGGKLIVPKTEEQVKAESEAEDAKESSETEKLTELQRWSELSGVAGTKVQLSTIYMNGALRYKGVFGKVPRGYTGQYGQSFTIDFMKNGIKVFEDKCTVTGMADSNGKLVTYQISGEISMSAEDYKSLDNYTVGWIL